MGFICGIMTRSVHEMAGIPFDKMIGYGFEHVGNPYRVPSKLFSYRDHYSSVSAVMFDSIEYNELIAESEEWVVALDGVVDSIECYYHGTDPITSPCRTILALIEQRGIESIQHINGDFVLSLINKLDRCIYLYRSIFGVRPLVYYWAGSSRPVGWASSIKQLSVIPSAAMSSFKEVYAADFLAMPVSTIVKNTPYDDIYHVLPGECLEIRAEGVRKLFTKDFELIDLHYFNKDELVHTFRSLFYESVRNRLRHTTSEIMISLSGGLDSSAVASAASDLLRKSGSNKELNLHHLLHEGEGNELPYAEAVAAHIGSPLRISRAESFELIQSIRDLAPMPHYEPNTAVMGPLLPALDHASIIHKPQASLSGIGGDQLVAGSRLYPAGMLRRFKILGAITELSKIARGQQRSYYYVLKKHALAPLFSKYASDQVISFCVSNELLTESFCNKWNLADRLNQRLIDRRFPPDQQEEYEQLRFGSQWICVDGQHWHYERHPFLDYRLAQFCLSLPWHYKTNAENQTKIILREAMKNIMPQVIVNRKGKSGHFGTLVSQLAATTIIDEIKAHSCLVEFGIVQKKKYHELLGYLKYGSLQLDVIGLTRIIEFDIWLIAKFKLSAND